MRLVKYTEEGSVVCREGKPADYFVIVKSGECDVWRKDFSTVFVNNQSGQIKITPSDINSTKPAQ